MMILSTRMQTRVQVLYKEGRALQGRILPLKCEEYPQAPETSHPAVVVEPSLSLESTFLTLPETFTQA